MFNDKSILITGGTGSFGKRYVKTLLDRYRPAVDTSASSPGCEVPASLAGSVASVSLTRPVSVDRTVAMQRLDWLKHGGGQRLTFRYALSRVERGDYYWWPYPDFVAPLNDNGLRAWELESVS